jgi:D-alanine transfer protein
LLDAIKELHIEALIISMPLAGARDDLEGIEQTTRHECYYSRVEAMCHLRGIAVNTMESHDLDTDFLVDYVSHPTAVGWLHINRLLDDFWHNRPITTT